MLRERQAELAEMVGKLDSEQARELLAGVFDLLCPLAMAVDETRDSDAPDELWRRRRQADRICGLLLSLIEPLSEEDLEAVLDLGLFEATKRGRVSVATRPAVDQASGAAQGTDQPPASRH